MSVARDESNSVVLQRVIMPRHDQQDAAMLYLDTGAAFGAQLNTMTGAVKATSDDALAGTGANAALDMALRGVNSRRAVTVEPGQRLSLGTYFNAFPASYWRRWSVVDEIVLSVKTSGPGTITVYKSNARGSIQHEQSIQVEGETTTEVPLSLKSFGDGGWYWFDAVAGPEAFIVEEATWYGLTPPRERAKLSVEITTMDKADYCIRNLKALAADPETMALIDDLVVVDQGKKLLVDHPEFAEVSAALSPKLRVIEQSNLGGSGGFSRGMYEAVERGSDFVLLLDDDIELEPETITRLVTFGTYTKRPTLVGAHMFDLAARSVLHTFGEVVNRETINPDVPLAGQYLGHDFARANLRDTPWLHRRTDVDYNGWWGCLIPTQVIREIGLSLPLFLKWDDAEYGLRAQAAGYPTVSLPGAAVWHISWANKDDTVGWQAYYHSRNRLIVGLLYSPYATGGRVLFDTGALDFKHMISMQYYTTALRLMAQADVLGGPDALFDLQSERIGEVRALGKTFSDADFRPDTEDFPEIVFGKKARAALKSGSPSYALLAPKLLKILTKQFLPVGEDAQEHPEAHLAHVDNKWWRLSNFDSALVTNAEGTAMSWYRRKPEVLRKQLVKAGASNAQLRRRWRALSRDFKRALPQLTALERWAEEFRKHTKNEHRS